MHIKKSYVLCVHREDDKNVTRMVNLSLQQQHILIFTF